MEAKVIKGKYRLDRIIAKGGMSTVFLCTNMELGNQWVAKYIENQYCNKLFEYEILKKLYHISLPRIIDVYHDAGGMYIIQGYIQGIPLNQKLTEMKMLDEEQIIDYSFQLCEVLLYLHNMKPKAIVHKDLKPSNIIVTADEKLVLIDFGISVELGNEKGALKAATNAYAAPEQLLEGGICDIRSDIYSLGVIIYQMLRSGQAPQNRHAAGNQISSIRESMLDICERCTRFMPEERYQRVEEIKKQLAYIREKLIVAKARKRNRIRLAFWGIVISSTLNYLSILAALLII